MIRFTLESNGKGIWVNHEHIVDVIENSAGKTNITFAHDSYQVTESPEEVARKVLDYKLTMENYKASVNDNDYEFALVHENYLQQLAGLKEQNNE